MSDPIPPPAGTLGVGELLIDATTRRMWFGVSSAIDPEQALLVGDLVALQENLDDLETELTDMIETGLDGKANTVHTHTASQITDFDDAVQDAVGAAGALPVGSIIMWYGPLNEIGLGVMQGWQLCDGTNGTPDLRDKFVLGAGGLLSPQAGVVNGSTGGATSFTGATGASGAHSHGGATLNHTLTISQMPLHDHTVSQSGHTHNQRYADCEDLYGLVANASAPYHGRVGVSQTDGNGYNTDEANAVIVVTSRGNDAPHNHGISSESAHTHEITSLPTMPPWKGLAYIMKMPPEE